MKRVSLLIFFILVFSSSAWGATHWAWILSMKTDFWISYVATELRSAEYDWVASHYDIIISGTINEHKYWSKQHHS